MRLRRVMPLVVSGVALLGGCHSDLNQPGNGSIETLVVGLPAGVSVTFTVTGPNEFSETITDNGTLLGLDVGTYTVAAPAVTDDVHVYATSTTEYTVEVTSDAVSALTLEYALASGLLDVTLTGVPASLGAAVVITGPNAFSRALDASATVSGLPAGTYAVLAATIDSAGHSFASPVELQTLDVVPSTQSIPVLVDYQLATGRAVVNIAGLPEGIAADVSVSGPNDYTAPLTASETLIRLAPGAYTIVAQDVVVDGHTYAADDAVLNIIPNRVSLQANISYQQVTGELRFEVTGLPTGINADVSVDGPNGFSQSITGPDTLVGLEPGPYTISVDSVNASGFIYEPLDSDQNINLTAGAPTTVAVAYAFTGSSSFDLTVPRAYLVQSVQRSDGDVALVAGRDALARVFVMANGTNTFVPDVRLRMYHNGVLVETLTMTADRLDTPTSISEQTMNASWNAFIPGSLVVDGLSLDIVADPDNVFPELNEANNTFPATGQFPVNVSTLPPFEITLIPVRQAQFTGDINTGNADEFLDDTWRMFPAHAINWQVHDVFTTSAPTLMSGDQNNAWGTVLSEIRTLRISEGASGYYYGVVAVNYNSGVAGLGYVPSSASSQSKASIGWDYLPSGSEVLAHELGHNFGRRHAPCGGPAGVDPSYPYSNAAIGQFGYDIVAGVIKTSGRPDIMSYCNNPWVSDYTYEGILARREAEAALGVSSEATTNALLVWGRITDDAIHLEPAFEIVARPVLPENTGAYLLEGLGPNGEVSFSYRFSGEEVADLPDGVERHFAFLLPVNAQAPPLHTLRITGSGLSVERTSRVATIPNADPADTPLVFDGAAPDRVRLQWNDAATPMILVRNTSTGQILSFARGGDATIHTEQSAVELVMSDGVTSSVRIVRR